MVRRFGLSRSLAVTLDGPRLAWLRWADLALLARG
jgi:hypothetical protein